MHPAPDGRKVRGWCFTANLGVSRADADLEAGVASVTAQMAAVAADTAVARCVVQLEQAPGTGMLHLQGYVEFQNARRLSTVRYWVAAYGMQGAHLEPRKGTPQQAWDYCKKDESRVAGRLKPACTSYVTRLLLGLGVCRSVGTR